MKINKLSKLFLLLLSLSLSSCFSDVIIDVEEERNLLVLNAWLTAGESPQVNVYASKSIFEAGSFSKLSNVELMVLEEGNPIGSLTQNENGNYVNDQIIISADRTYTFRATHPSYPSAEAKVLVPKNLDDERLKLTHAITEVREPDGYTYQGSEIGLEIMDDGNSADFYAIGILNEYLYYDENYMEDTVKYEGLSGGLNTADPQVDYLYVSYGQMLGITDEFFNGSLYRNTFTSYNDLRYYESGSGSGYYMKESNSIVVYKFNKALYQYFLSLENNQYPEAFTEPTQVYSNVEGGYGIIGAASSYAIAIEEERNNNYN